METILEEFVKDIESLERSLDLIHEIEQLKKYDKTDFTEHCIALLEIVTDLQEHTKEAAVGLRIMKGTSILYLAGRFEVFVRTIIEELSSTIAKSKSKFEDLPRNMKTALIQNTAEVIANPRKYGHGDGARDNFIKNLHNNIHANDLSVINYQCLSITTRNMKYDVVKDLFDLTGFNNLWKEVGKDHRVKKLFTTTNDDRAESESRARLDAFMDKRNLIAHGSVI